MRHIVYIPVDRHVDRECYPSCKECELRIEDDFSELVHCPFRRSPAIEWNGLAPHVQCPVWSPGARLEYRED